MFDLGGTLIILPKSLRFVVAVLARVQVMSNRIPKSGDRLLPVNTYFECKASEAEVALGTHCRSAADP